jgi:hypothetical protein
MTKQQIAGVVKLLWETMTEEEREAVTARMWTTHRPLITEALEIAEG